MRKDLGLKIRRILQNQELKNDKKEMDLSDVSADEKNRRFGFRDISRGVPHLVRIRGND